MLKIEEKGPIEQLRILSVKLGGDFREGRSSALLDLDNENGKGIIYTYGIMQGLSIKAFNITLTKDISFRTGGGTDSPIFMICCLKGRYDHISEGGGKAVRIHRGQNVIYSPADNKLSTIELPADVPLKICLISIEKAYIPAKDLDGRNGLEQILKDLYSRVGSSGQLTRLQGRGSKVEEYASLLIENRRTDVVGRLMTEAAVLNTMAAQLDLREKDGNEMLEVSPLIESDMERIITAVSEMQSNLQDQHTIKLFSRRTGISPKKIQEGFRFIFGRSFANFLKDMRLELARDLIDTTDLPISHIADNIGISSKSHLSRIFRERFGMSPRDYRESLVNATMGFELTYRSKASMFVGEWDVSLIVEKSNLKNLENGVTGCLIYYRDNFFQILEGPKRQVLATYEEIKNDTRHEHVEVLHKGPRRRRVFKEKGMILLSDKDIAIKHSTGRNLSVDMDTLFTNDLNNQGLSSKMFWERLRNRILTSEVA